MVFSEQLAKNNRLENILLLINGNLAVGGFLLMWKM